MQHTPRSVQNASDIKILLILSVSYLYEANGDTFRPNVPTMELWLVGSFFDGKMSLGFGAGICAVVKYHNSQYGNIDDDFLSGIVSMTADYRFLPHWA